MLVEIKSSVDDLNENRSTVRMRVAFVLRSTEVQLLVRRFVRDGYVDNLRCFRLYLVLSPPPCTPTRVVSGTPLSIGNPPSADSSVSAAVCISLRAQNGCSSTFPPPPQSRQRHQARSAQEPVLLGVFAFFAKPCTDHLAISNAIQYPPGC